MRSATFNCATRAQDKFYATSTSRWFNWLIASSGHQPTCTFDCWRIGHCQKEAHQNESSAKATSGLSHLRRNSLLTSAPSATTFRDSEANGILRHLTCGGFWGAKRARINDAKDWSFRFNIPATVVFHHQSGFLTRRTLQPMMLIVMNAKSRRPKSSTDYPEKTTGSEAAARGRARANKMTDAQREEYFRRGMVLIYGGQLPKKTVAGH
jgi:hypothetical protein